MPICNLLLVVGQTQDVPEPSDLHGSPMRAVPAFRPHRVGRRSASGTGARSLLTVRDDSWPDLMAAGCGTTASDSAPGATAVPSRASPVPTEAPQALACGGSLTWYV